MPEPITTAFDAAWRDYETAGVPASGPHEPVKAEIRAAGAAIAIQFDLLVNGVAVGNAKGYTTKLQADADRPNRPVGSFLVVYADPDPALNTVWANNGLTLVDTKLTLSGADRAMLAALPTLIAQEASDRAALISRHPNNPKTLLEIIGADRFSFVQYGEGRANFGNCHVFTERDGIGVELAGEDGFLMPGQAEYQPEPIKSLLPYFGPQLCGVAGETYAINLPGLMADRADALRARMTISPDKGPALTSRDQVLVTPSTMGAAARLVIWPTEVENYRFGQLTIKVTSAAKNPPSNGAPAILNIGDSILYRELGARIHDWLVSYGYAPTWIGTLVGEAAPSGTLGRNGECKPGHDMADFVYLFTGRVSPLAPGQEAVYLGYTDVNDKRAKNTLIRAATGSDAAADIRNGYVIDFEFYRTRWTPALPVPTMLLWQAGRNDIRDVLSTSLYQHYYDIDSLMFRRWFAAYPAKWVLRVFQPPARDPQADKEWAESYTEAIRGILKAAADANAAQVAAGSGNSGRVMVVPAWAMTTIDADFDLAASPEVVDAFLGAVEREILDWIHQTGGARSEVARVTAAYIASVATGAV